MASGIDFDEFVTDMAYDALGRPILVSIPQTYDLSARKTIVPVYNRAGALESVTFDGTEYVKHIAYDAKGQSLMAAYNNGIMTRQVYDPKTFRVVRAKTEKYTTSGHTFTPVSGTSNVRQDTFYEYDLVGNILKMKDRTPDSGINNTILGTDALDRIFKYDPLYRLLEATGREANNTPAASGYDDPGKYINPPTPGGAPNAYQTRAYKQKYTYDKMGRMVKTVQLGTNGWTRNYTYVNGINRLEEVRDGSNSLLSGFSWDVNGNMTGNNSERHYRYDHADRMTTYYNKPALGDATKYAAYFYDGSGARNIKFVWTPNTGWECVTYVDGMFEYHHNHTSSTDEYKNYIQVDGGIEIRVGAYSDDTEPAVIYSGSDHLSSVSFRLDTSGNIIEREEYYPYGETSLRTFERKRYRYTGKEKDAESGLYYYGARYYVPWLASFTSTDPAAMSTFYQSSYNYADCNPIVMNDPTGMSSEGQVSGGNATRAEQKGGEASGVAQPRGPERSAIHNSLGDGVFAEVTADRIKNRATTDNISISIGSNYSSGLDNYSQLNLSPPKITPSLSDIHGEIREYKPNLRERFFGKLKEWSEEPIQGNAGYYSFNPMMDPLWQKNFAVKTWSSLTYSLWDDVWLTGQAYWRSPENKTHIDGSHATISESIDGTLRGMSEIFMMGTGGIIGKGANTTKNAANIADDVLLNSTDDVLTNTVDDVAEGSFSVFDWQGYPAGGIKPTGPFRLLEGAEYTSARNLANSANAALHKANPELKGLHIHEIHPIKFGGSPTDPSNKVYLSPQEHARYTTFWNRLMRSIR